VLLVTGTITTDPGATAQKVRTFVQTFYLAPALTTAKSGRPCPLAPARSPPRVAYAPFVVAASYYVLNDTLRLLDAPKAVSAVSACLPLATLPPLTPPSKQPKPVAKAAPKLKEVSPGPASEPAPKSPAPSLEAPTGPLTWAQRAAKGAAKGAAKDAAPAPTPAPTPAPKAEAEAAAEAAPVLDPLSLYVKSLPDGEIRSVSIKEDRGYAFEDFKSPEATVAALAKGANADVTDEVSSNNPPPGGRRRSWRLLSLQTTCYCKPGNRHLGNASLSRTFFSV
jgi:hypothetical protein